MNTGRILYLNGVTSTGKTSIVNALRARGDVDFYFLSDDLFEDYVINTEYADRDYWTVLAEAVFLMYRTARLFCEHGKNVVIDSMLLEREAFAPHYEKMLEIFHGIQLDIVEVFCPLEICRQRNLIRGDRHEYQSHEQASVMAMNVQYSLHLDTSITGPDECAAQIAKMLFEIQPAMNESRKPK